MRQRKPTGYIVWEDATRFAVLTLGSRNRKTGAMAQCWIMLRDVHPARARQIGADVAVCGTCPFSGARGCYVSAQALGSIYRTYRRGRYPHVSLEQIPELVRGRLVRLGAYGDPAMLPIPVLQALTSTASGWTGYTHQWEHCRPEYARFMMASADTPRLAEQAKARGYRAFTLTLAGEPAPPKHILCPASEPAGHKLSCDACRACDGLGRTKTANAASVYIPIHGYQTRRAEFVIRTIRAREAACGSC